MTGSDPGDQHSSPKQQSTGLSHATADGTQLSVGWGLKVAARLIRHPALAVTGLRQALILAPRNWWRSWPPLPLPAPDYLHFRSVTAYGGDGDRPPDPDDVADWLHWVKAWPSVTGNSNTHNRSEN